MRSGCEAIHDFLDGELSELERRSFRVHLAKCKRCQDELTETMHLAAMEIAAPVARAETDGGGTNGGADGGLSGRDDDDRSNGARSRRARIAFAVASVLVAAAALLLFLSRDRGGPAAQSESQSQSEFAVAMASTTERRLEVRFQSAEADRHRTYAVLRSSSSRKTPWRLPLGALSELEERRSWSSLLAAHAINGELTSAAAHLEHLKGAPAMSDKSALELLEGRAKDALASADAALADNPQLTQARWNKALALRDLGLDLAAAVAFDVVAERGEPGWSAEARERAAALRTRYEGGKKSWDEAAAARELFLTSDVPLAPIVISTRAWLALDAAYTLTMQAKSTADLDRAAAVAKELDDGELKKTIALRRKFLRGSSRDDPFVQFAAIANSRRPTDITKLKRLAAAIDDPWFYIRSSEKSSHTAVYIERDYARAVRVAEAQRERCASARRSRVCGKLDAIAGTAFTSLGRGALGMEKLEATLQQARRQSDWRLERSVLYRLGESLLELRSDSSAFALGRAYAEEIELRSPRCETAVAAATKIAAWLVRNNRWSDARKELAAASHRASRECESFEHTLDALRNEATIAVATNDTTYARTTATRITDRLPRTKHTSNRDRRTLLLAQAELLQLLEPGRGEAQLIEISQGDAPEIAREAREILALDDAKNGRWASAAERFELPACSGAVVARSHVAVVVRGAAGAAAGSITTLADGEAVPEASSVIPARLQALWRECEGVEIVASRHYYGSTQILPRTRPWFFRSRSRKKLPSETVPGPKVIVSDVTPPSMLGLPTLRSLSVPNNLLSLHGTAATPTAILGALERASYVEVHAHGISSTQGEAYVALSPDSDGSYALTAAKISGVELRGRPIVVLAACHAGKLSGDKPWGLVEALMAAGALAVVASPQPIDDATANSFFARLRDRVGGDVPLGNAVFDTAKEWSDSEWPASLVIFR